MDFKRQIPDELTPLMPAEQNLLSSWTANEEVDWRTGDTVIDDPKNFADWGPNRVIRGRFFEWLCTDAIELPKPLGRINLSGIYIFGRPNLSFREIPIPLILQQCAIPAGINLAYANCRVLEISGSYLGSISANNMSASLLSIGPQSTLTGMLTFALLRLAATSI